MCLEERADIVTDNYVLDDLLGLFDTHFPNNSLEDFEYRGSLGDFVHLSKTDRYMAKTKEQIKAFFKDFTNYSQESSKALMEQVHEYIPTEDVIGSYSCRQIMDVAVRKASSIRGDILGHPMVRNSFDMESEIYSRLDGGLMEDIYSKERMLNNLTPELVRDYLDGMNRDDKRRCLCDIIGIGYFDDKEGEKFQEWVNKIHEMKW